MASDESVTCSDRRQGGAPWESSPGHRQCRRRSGLILAEIPGGGQAYAVVEAYLRPEAQLGARLVDRVAIVGAEQLDAKPSHDGLPPGAGELSEHFGGITGGVERMVGDVEAWRARTDLTRDRVQELRLGERMVVGDVVGLAQRMLVLEREHQPLNHVR